MTALQLAASQVAGVLQGHKAWGRRLFASRELLHRLRDCAPPPPPSHGPREAVQLLAPAPPSPSARTLDELREAARACVRCPHLVAFRKQVVFGVGNPRAELMFVGEAPGAEEDAQGEPFVGPAGRLLTKIIATMGFTRQDVYIANILKCRPDIPPGTPGNRKPRPEEMAQCRPWLEAQIRLIRPRVMVALGGTAVEGLLGATDPISRIRGRWHEYQGIPLMPTYHPSYLLRGDKLADKRRVWEDMLAVLEKLGRPVTEKQRGYFRPA